MSCRRVFGYSYYHLISLPVTPPYHTCNNARGNPQIFFNRLIVTASLLVDIMLGILCMSDTGTPATWSRRTVESLKIAYENVRHNLQERTDKQADSEEKLSIPHYQPG